MSNVIFYDNLLKEKNGLLRYISPSNNSLIICHQYTNRKFAYFDTYFDYIKFFENLKKERRCCYEVILNRYQKPYFDIETTDINIDSEGLILDLIKCILETHPSILKSDIMVFSSHGKNKISYHVIIDNWCFPNCSENSAFARTVISKMNPIFIPYIDFEVYKSKQQMRLFGNHKYVEDLETVREKILNPLSPWILKGDVRDDRHKWTRIFLSSLISNATYCKYMPSWLEEKKTLRQIIESSDKDINKAISLIPEEFCFDGKVGSLIKLKRLKPSYCSICLRIHEAENPYLIIKDNQILLNCRRNKNSQFLGFIDTDKEMSISGEIITKSDCGSDENTRIETPTLPTCFFTIGK